MNDNELSIYTGKLQDDTIKVLRDETKRLAKLISNWEAKIKELGEQIELHSKVKADLELLLMGRE